MSVVDFEEQLEVLHGAVEKLWRLTFGDERGIQVAIANDETAVSAPIANDETAVVASRKYKERMIRARKDNAEKHKNLSTHGTSTAHAGFGDGGKGESRPP